MTNERNNSVDYYVDMYMSNEPTNEQLQRRIDTANQRINAVNSDIAHLQETVNDRFDAIDRKLDTLFELLRRHVQNHDM